MGMPEELQNGNIMRHSTSCPQGNEGLPNTSVLTLQHSSPGGKCPGPPARTHLHHHYWSFLSWWYKMLWNKHKTEHHFCSKWQCRQCLTTWICPRTHDSSSSWDWGLTCLFSITNALDVFTVVLNKTDQLLTYHIQPNKFTERAPLETQHNLKGCLAGTATCL